ncbi:hypothetical protein [Neptuniibacter sp. CAU 1671]|uniref:hypothetical protein n=1 Tax=Neptuniibacter sp. CAU 1671 TaxID=3032593 RepID=UPI0023DA6A92|nr:hypothetical protein [Neptuniibacter sp. CAU 1671]MDF2181191.1 hypothetical protein [Neptuniibacter sp. CAU 1671]
MPKRAKGKRYDFEVSCVAWGDLLGYGSMIESAKFHPKDKTTIQAIRRLKTFQQVAMGEASRTFRAMPINDGVAFFCDLSPRSSSVTADFLQRSITAFNKINTEDKKAGHPGMRMVISVGPRARIARPKRSSAHLRNILSRLTERLISPEHAVNEAFTASPVAGFVPALQANFGFTRAYLAESGGSRKGFKGANCFIDMSLFETPHPNWISFNKFIEWSDRGFDAVFGELLSADWTEAGSRSYSGITNTIDLANNLGMGNSYEIT